MTMTVEEYKRAEFEVGVAEEKRGFKIHAAVFGLVMTGLIVLNVLLIAYTDADFPWVIFPFIGWAVGLTFHYLGAYRHEGETVRAHQEAIERYAERSKIAV
ncbi:MAG TPA: 2TM domain-containing protein [Gaiellaceae bacterium]|nr:2TM domain-containing protein [Candidatus Eisenbacteria bacterium]HEU4971429.1 2TM domain-containing protein [Gaiellaceae bacterium]